MPKIFISYRRADSRKDSGRIYDSLIRAFGKDNIFKDVDNIPLGKDFRGVLREAVANCDVLLVMIGKQWLNIKSDDGTRRLDNPNDFVRIEIESGLQRDNCLVIPVLVDNAPMPNPQDLPPSLRELAFKNATIVRDDPDFHKDVEKIVRSLQLEYQPAQEPRANKPAKLQSESNIPFAPIMIAVFVVMVIVAVVGLVLSSQSTDETTQTPTTQAVAQLETEPTNEPESTTESGLSEEDVRATGAAQAYETLTALAPTETPTITPTPTETPISASEIQKTAQAEIFATETSAVQTQAVFEQQTQNAVLTEQFIAGSTATFIAQLSLTPPATDTLEPTNTPAPPTSTNIITNTPPHTPEVMPTQPPIDEIAEQGVTSNQEWRDLVGIEGYSQTFSNGFVNTDMLLVPAGEFEMGSSLPDANSDETPHQQTIEAPFWIAKYEVTNAEFAIFLNNNPNGNTSSIGFKYLDAVDSDSRIRENNSQWTPNSGFENHPVVEVTWYGARDYCKWLGEADGFRLPTEKEWEYAASGPSNWEYPWGDDWNENYAIWDGNSDRQTVNIGSRPQDSVSWVGAYDFAGNVQEWVSSLYREYDYDSSHESNIYVPDNRVLRGGSWNISLPTGLRTSVRGNGGPNASSLSSGFRCARSINGIKNEPDHASCIATVNLDPGASLHLRAQPRADSLSMDLIPVNTILDILQEKDGWLQAEFEGTIGWFDSQYIDLECDETTISQEVETASTTTIFDNANCTAVVDLDPGANLQFREEPSTNGISLDLLPSGTELEILGENESGDWYLAEYEGQEGWLMSQYVNVNCNAVQETEVFEVITSTSSPCVATVVDLDPGVQLNLRQTPNSNSTVVARAEINTQIEIHGRSTDNKWVNGLLESQNIWLAINYVSLTCEINSLPVTGN